MNFLPKTVLLVCLLSLAGLLYSEEQPEPDNLFLTRLLVSSEVKRSLNLTPAIIRQEMNRINRRRSGMSKNEIKALQDELLARYHPDELEKQMLVFLAEDEALDETAVTALVDFLEGEQAGNLSQRVQDSLLKENKPELLQYKSKISKQAPQEHRTTMAKAYDGLNHISEWQARLKLQIRKDIHDRLVQNNSSEAKNFSALELDEHTQSLRPFNELIHLFAFRKTPSSEIVPVLDSLASESNRAVFNALDQCLDKTLNYRSELNLQLN